MHNVAEASIKRFSAPSSRELADTMANSEVSCAELAEAIAVDKRTRQAWRNGRKNPRLSRYELQSVMEDIARKRGD